MNAITSIQQEAVLNFNMYTSEFIASIIEIYPENTILQNYNNRFHLLCKANPFKSVEYFHEFVYIYRDRIVEKDIDFFVHFDEHNTIHDDNSLLDALQLKELWLRLNEDEKEENKSTIFMYLELLMLFTDKYYE